MKQTLAEQALNRLTPAGLQVERALELGYDGAAFNLYYDALADDVPMVEGEEPEKVSVWPEWHRMIHALIGEGEVLGEAVANEEADELGLDGKDREDYVDARIDELNEEEPSIIEQRERNSLGEVVAVRMVPNPRAGGEEPA